MWGEVPEELKAKIREHYQKGQGSMQDYARIYGVPIEKVLEICGENDLMEVEMIGDLVDQSEIGKTGTVNPGDYAKTHITLN
jgi:hypothetical protein